MRYALATLVFLLSLALTYYYVMHSGQALPPMTAVHFDAAGTANSFMTRAQYLHFMGWFSVVLPLFIVAATSLVYSRANNFKVPHRDYWMAPEQQAATRSYLIGHGIWFGTLLAGLMCFMHWIVINANQLRPPHLANHWALGGLLVFLGATLSWAMVLMLAFRRPR